MPAALLLVSLASAPADAQIYKWVDENGKVHYTNDPYRAKQEAERAGSIETQREIKSAAPAPAHMEGSPDEAALATDEGSEQKSRVELVGDIEFTHSVSGRATLNARIVNRGKLPVRDVALDVMLFKPDGERVDISIPFTGGKTKPDRLAADEEGFITYETPLYPEEVFAHKYRLRWREFDLAAPPAKGAEAPEGVIHKVIKHQPSEEEATTETTPSETAGKAQKLEKQPEEPLPESRRWRSKIAREKMRKQAEKESEAPSE